MDLSSGLEKTNGFWPRPPPVFPKAENENRRQAGGKRRIFLSLSLSLSSLPKLIDDITNELVDGALQIDIFASEVHSVSGVVA